MTDCCRPPWIRLAVGARRRNATLGTLELFGQLGELRPIQLGERALGAHEGHHDHFGILHIGERVFFAELVLEREVGDLRADLTRLGGTRSRPDADRRGTQEQDKFRTQVHSSHGVKKGVSRGEHYSCSLVSEDLKIIPQPYGGEPLASHGASRLRRSLARLIHALPVESGPVSYHAFRPPAGNIYPGVAVRPHETGWPDRQ